MKFEYDKGECLGVIDGDGDLVVPDGSGGIVYLTQQGKVFEDIFSIIDLVETGDCIHKFYKGDKVTVTF